MRVQLGEARGEEAAAAVFVCGGGGEGCCVGVGSFGFFVSIYVCMYVCLHRQKHKTYLLPKSVNWTFATAPPSCSYTASMAASPPP